MPLVPMDRVAGLLREVSATSIMPRYRLLTSDDIEEKSPDDFVTTADRESEAALTAGLTRLLPGSRVIGEEMCHGRPELLDDIATAEEPLWIVDPLDGTGNFMKGDPRFAVMVALVIRNETVAGWMLRPAGGTLAWAERCSGAFLDQTRVRAPTAVPETGALRGAVLTRFLSDEMKRQIERNSARLGEVFPGSLCAGFDYPALAAGEMDFVQYWRGMPWDHAPGALYLLEAGGSHTRFDGSPWRPGERRTGLLAAGNSGIALAVRRALELG